jgi:hypothetical protein
MIAATIVEIPQWGNVTLIEAIWLLAGVVAFAFAALRMRPLLKDYQRAGEAGEADICIIAKGYLRRELIRMAQSLCVISVGLYAAAEAPAVPGSARISIVGLVVTGVLIAISALVAFQSFFDWRDRNEIRRILGGSQ